MTNNLNLSLELIDKANAADPNQEINSDGELVAKELLYSQRMSNRLNVFKPQASEHLQIAARAQHIERWTSLRSDYPAGLKGYQQWRIELGKFHARRAAELMLEAGYSEADAQRCQQLVQKRGIKRDIETQALEDVICLVFLEHYLTPFAQKHDEAKLIDIIQKTWAKMSGEGHTAALELPYSADMLALIKKALGA